MSRRPNNYADDVGLPDGPALPPGIDAIELSRSLHRLHDDFVQTGHLDHALRPVVQASWQRSVRSGLDPEASLARIVLNDAQLAAIRAVHPLAAVMPVIRRLLVDSAAEAGLLVAVSDAAGQLLWVEGAADLRRRAESMNFLPGADWSEASAGTNAPGTALALGRAVQIVGAEHLVRQVTPWSCSASPIREPDTGAMLGVLDITGGPDVAPPQTLALVRATVAAAEAELRLARLAPPPSRHASGWAAPRLEALGRRGARLSHGQTVTRLSPRHSEIAVLLSLEPDGFTAAELAVALSAGDHSEVTIRAELSRLRALLGPVTLDSRPYAFPDGLHSDVADVRAAVAQGRLRAAVAAYRGPLLPHSDAPAIVELRDELHLALRARLLATGDADTLLAFADTAYAHDDYEIWQAVEAALPASSPRRPEIEGRLQHLDLAFG